MASHTHRIALAWLVAGSWVSSPTAAPGQAVKQQPPVITAFSINSGADSVSAADAAVVLTHTVVGARPTEFRVSHRADFAGAKWTTYAAPLAIRDWYDASGATCATSHPSHRITLYLQVRANVGDEVRIVDGQRQLVPASVESNVLRATVCAHAAGQPLDDQAPLAPASRLP